MNTNDDAILRPVPRPGARGLRRVLVCLDRSTTSEACLPIAAALARGFGSGLRLVHVLESTPSPFGLGPPDALDWQLVREEAESYLADVAARVGAEGLRVETSLLEGHVAEQILCLADRDRADLIVLASHGEKGVTEWSLSSTAEKILARARTSLLLVPAEGARGPTQEGRRFGRVLVLLDGSPRAESVLPAFEWLARERGAALVLLSVVSPPELFGTGPPTAEDLELQRRLTRRNERAARAYLSELCTRLEREGCDARTVVERGDPRGVLPTVVAREGVDLVALSAHGQTGDRSSSHGHTANHVVRHAPAPILMLQDLPQRASEFATEVRHRREATPLPGRRGDEET